LVGDGPDKIALKKYVLNSNVSEKVFFFDHNNNIGDLLPNIDIVVVPSISESFGLTILESLYFNKIILASDVGGIPEILKCSEYGILCPPGDSLFLAKKIDQLLFNLNGKNDYPIIAGRSYVNENFNVISSIDLLVKIFEEFIADES
jgi:glycosyltransferase involved in cell wall biosynthesis